MLPIGLNHMTVPDATTHQLLELAKALGSVGVELRKDLDRPLFDGEDPAQVAVLAATRNQRILALAEVKAFNERPEDKRETVQRLIDAAVACAAEGIALIPALAPQQLSRSAQRAALRHALEFLQPLLQKAGIKGLIEPLGFATSTLRFKEDVVAVLGELGGPACFGMVHDTFHHHLASEETCFPDQTAIVHVSGVTSRGPTVAQMTDAHRVLVDADDRLDTIGQLRDLCAAGYTGPVSFEVFATEIHDLKDPATALARSIAFINDGLADVTAGAA